MRLTAGMIEIGVKKFVSEKYDDIVRLAEDARNMAGAMVYDAIFSMEGDYMISLREGWYSFRSSFYFSPTGSIFCGYVHVCECVRVPMDGYIRVIPSSASLEACEDAYVKYMDANAKRDTALKRKRELSKEISAFAKQFRTVEKLGQHNEALALCCAVLANVTPNAPALTCDQIFQNYPEIKNSCKG